MKNEKTKYNLINNESNDLINLKTKYNLTLRTTTATDRDNQSGSIIKGGLLVIVASALSATNDALFKYAQNYKSIPETQLLFGRYLIQLIIAGTLWITNIPKRPMVNNEYQKWYGNNKSDIAFLWVRGFLYGIGGVLYFYSCITLPIGDQNAIIYSSACLTSFLANIVLDEPLPNIKLLIPTIILCVSGVVCLCQPSFLLDLFGFDDGKTLDMGGIIAAVADSIIWSIVTILIRKTPDSHFLQLGLTASVQIVGFVIPLTVFVNYFTFKDKTLGWVTTWDYRLLAFVFLICIGIVGFMRVTAGVVGFQSAVASKISWLQYSALVVAFIYQITIFGDVPNKYEILGACLTVFGCFLPLAPEIIDFCKNGIKKEEKQVVGRISTFASLNYNENDNEYRSSFKSSNK